MRLAWHFLILFSGHFVNNFTECSEVFSGISLALTWPWSNSVFAGWLGQYQVVQRHEWFVNENQTFVPSPTRTPMSYWLCGHHCNPFLSCVWNLESMNELHCRFLSAEVHISDILWSGIERQSKCVMCVHIEATRRKKGHFQLSCLVWASSYFTNFWMGK